MRYRNRFFFMKYPVIVTALVGVTVTTATAISIFGPGHMDLRANVDASGAWTTELHHDGQGSTLDSGPAAGSRTLPANTDSVIFITEESSLPRPASSIWSFLGNAAGEDLWIFPANQNTNIPFLGINAEMTQQTTLGNWNPARTDVMSGRWMEIRLMNMAYSGDSMDPQFSMWTNPPTGGVPNVWMDTADGIATDGTEDGYFIGAGGHAHMNWGFTATGIYDLTFQGRTTLANNQQSVSDLFTMRFGIGVVPEPSGFLLGALSMSLLFTRRR